MTSGWKRALALFAFFLSDWALIAALPRARRSFGPAKPPTLILAGLRLVPAVLPRPWDMVSQAIGSLLVGWSFWIEPHRLTLTRQKLVTSKLASGVSLRVLHLGDLHVERLTDRERRLLEWARREAPDVILFSGDFLNLSNVHDPAAWDEARTFLRELHAPLGVYAVTGSPPVDPPEVVARLVEGLDIHWLRDEKVTLEHQGARVDLIGITCTHKPFQDGPRLREVLGSAPDPFTILLYHTPDLAPQAAHAGIDLQLSGHTHGGQVRLPFYGALVTASLYGKRFEAGRHELDGLTLYVTRGIGLEGMGAPRARFLCPPEVVLWEIEGE